MMFKVITLSFALSLPLWAADPPSPANGSRFHDQNPIDLKDPHFSLPLTPKELAFLQRLDHINMCVDPDWMPYDFINDRGDYVGINSDFHRIIARRIGKEVRIVKTVTWEQSLEYARRGKCDILSSAQITEARKQFLSFSRPYSLYPIVIATRTDQPYVDDINGILGSRLVTVKGYAISEMLKKKYPGIHIVEVENARTGLEWVASGKAFGYLDTVATIGYQTQKHGILNIKISGATNETYAMAVAVRNGQPLLLSIIDKAVASLSEADKLPILNKWISIKFEQKEESIQTWKILTAIGVILLLFALREYVVNRYKSKLETLNKELDQLSNTDPLTGIANRHFLNSVFKMEIARAQRYFSKFSIIMMDVDYFKMINDKFGHNEGDRVLKNIAHAVAELIRTNDTVGRWGGEEFLILCPETDVYGTLQLAETIRQKIEQLDFGIPMKITVSLGVAEYRDHYSLEGFVKMADNALYEAKNSGRNQVKATL